jgi:hypothetical protein
MLAYADVCWRLLMYADVCWRFFSPGGNCGAGLEALQTSLFFKKTLFFFHSGAGLEELQRSLSVLEEKRARLSQASSNVCWRMLAYADVC